MKVHNDLKELLVDFWMSLPNTNKNKGVAKYYVDKYLESTNSLALGKPEPLAKNKQFEQVCACIPSPPFINEDNLNIPYCRWCGEDFKQT